ARHWLRLVPRRAGMDPFARFIPVVTRPLPPRHEIMKSMHNRVAAGRLISAWQSPRSCGARRGRRLVFAAIALFAALAASSTAWASKVTLETCEVSIRDEAQVPAEEAGVIVALEPNEGDYVEANALLGRIKDNQAQAELLLAKKEEEIAR